MHTTRKAKKSNWQKKKKQLIKKVLRTHADRHTVTNFTESPKPALGANRIAAAPTHTACCMTVKGTQAAPRVDSKHVVRVASLNPWSVCRALISSHDVPQAPGSPSPYALLASWPAESDGYQKITPKSNQVPNPNGGRMLAIM